MASVVARIKSLVSGKRKSRRSTQTPSTNDDLKRAKVDQSTPLHQKCQSLRTRLMRLRGLALYFALVATPDPRQAIDSITQLQDFFSTGISLCYIFDQLPGFPKINHSEYNPEVYQDHPDREKQYAVMLFVGQVCTAQFKRAMPECEALTVSDVWDRHTTDGLVKVINVVTAIVDRLPPTAFSSSPSNSTSDIVNDPLNAQELARDSIMHKVIETERKYVQDLELLQKYFKSLSERHLSSQNAIRQILPYLIEYTTELVKFQQKFLARLEKVTDYHWQDQRWGLPFIENEDGFAVYKPYCANYINASNILLANGKHLLFLNHLINMNDELPNFLLKPIQRIYMYPILLDSLLKTLSPTTYMHYEELQEGYHTSKRVADGTRDTLRRSKNAKTVQYLCSCIEDWKGHQVEHFGELFLYDILIVTKSGINREYHTFPFEKIILFCKEADAPKKTGKNDTPPKRHRIDSATPFKQQRMNILLKGRVFLSGVTRAVPSTVPTSNAQHQLTLWWKGYEDREYLALQYRYEEQMRQWESELNRLIIHHKTTRRRTPRHLRVLHQFRGQNTIDSSLLDDQNPFMAEEEIKEIFRPSSNDEIQLASHVPVEGMRKDNMAAASHERLGGDQHSNKAKDPEQLCELGDNTKQHLESPSWNLPSSSPRNGSELGQTTTPETPNPGNVYPSSGHFGGKPKVDDSPYPSALGPSLTLKSNIQIPDTNVTEGNNLNEGNIGHLRSGGLSESSEETAARHLLEALANILRSPEKTDELLKLKDTSAQIMIDFLHSTLLLPKAASSPWPRKRALIALYKLSKAAMLYPQCYVLKNIVPDILNSPEDCGGFCDIYRGHHPTEQKSFCLKAVRIYKKSETDKVLKMFSKEAILWAHLHHPNILPFYGVYYLDNSQRRICLVSPWMSHGNIVVYLKANPYIPRRPFVYDIVCGMEYLHRENIIHGDLKGMNVLVNDLGRACVADFGLSFVLTDKTFGFSNASSTFPGATNRWLSPELLIPPCRPSRESDVWAFSCVWYEVMTRQLPYHECSNDSQVVVTLFRGRSPTRPKEDPTSYLDKIDDDTWSSMKQCWKITPADRPTFPKILQELERRGYAREETETFQRDLEQENIAFQNAISEKSEAIVDHLEVQRILQEINN